MNKEDLDFLLNLQYKLNTQDNDGNADPLFWGVMEEKKVPAYPGCGNGTELVIDSEMCFTDDELDELKEWMCATEDFEDWEIEGVDTLFDAKEALDFKAISCELYSYEIKDVLSTETGAFLTKEACQHHIKINGHNLCKPHTYAMTAFRNYEYEQLLEILKTANFETALIRDSESHILE